MEAEVLVESVEPVETRTGKTRWVLRDAEGREYTTFRPGIGREAERFAGRRARIEFHEEDRGGFHNVYLDGISEAPEAEPEGGGAEVEEAAWNTAVEAAPWLIGTSEPKEAVPADELYEKLEPFKRRVADDIRDRSEDDG